MSDLKSKLPDLKELASISSKLFSDLKKSVGEIVQTYKDKRAQQAQPDEPVASEKEINPKKVKPVSEKKPASTASDDNKKE